LRFYLDTSVLVAAFTTETTTARVIEWLAIDRDLVTSDWSVTEFSSALALKLRTGQTSSAHRESALAAFSRQTRTVFEMLPVERRHFEMAARFCDNHRLGLRAPDALHLAVSMDNDARLCTLDKHLAEAGAMIGAGVLLI
jgi:predicted nucleic acid-binding protein